MGGDDGVKYLFTSSGLWDSIEHFVLDLLDDSVSASTTLAYPFLATTSRADVAVNREAGENGESIGRNNSLHPSEVAVAISEDIEDIKSRYIIGKIIGRNLVARNGRTIGRMGERITQQVIHEAETEGLLVDLIEHMTFDSFED